MSTFKVKLTQGNQGNLDTNGVSTGTSIQRSVYVMGPHKTNRLLKDGDTFTDSNYWKRYAYPQVSRENAIVSVVTDDGSVYVDGVNGNPGVALQAVVYNLSVLNGTTYTDAANIADILTDYGSYAVYAQITTSSYNVKMRINGTAVIDVITTTVQVFNPGDLNITKLEFANSNGGTATVEIMLSVAVASNS